MEAGNEVTSAGNVAFASPHADDETLSFGYALTWYARAGFNIHALLMSRGPVSAASLRYDGSQVCRFHPYTHEPQQEGYELPTEGEIGAARWAEFKTAVYAMTRITPATAGVTGNTFFYEGGLGTNYGCNGCASSTGAVTRQAVDAARAVLEPWVDSLPPNTHIRTMSPTDDHPDHAAVGIAAYEMWADPAWHTRMGDLMFAVSRLYWGGPNNTPPRPPDVAAEPCTWFPADTGLGPNNSIYNAVVDHLRNVVVPSYGQWLPPGAWAVGKHSVPSQFAANFGPSASVSNLWHPPVSGRSYPVQP